MPAGGVERRELPAHPVRHGGRARRLAQRERRPRGSPPRRAVASRASRSTSEPTNGARSVLLMTSRSARAIPGPPLRGMSSPPATSMTKICTSASAGLKTAVRLSPPLSTSTRSSGPSSRSSCSTASRFDRDVVADRRVRAAAGLHGDDPLARAARRSRARTARPRSCRCRSSRRRCACSSRSSPQSAAMRLLLPDPTGPPTPTRSAPLSWQRGAPCGRRGRLPRARSPTAAGGGCSAIGRASAATCARPRVDLGRELGDPARGVGGVEAEQLQRGAGDGRGVVVERDRRDLARRRDRRRRRRRRARPGAASYANAAR